MLNRKTVNRSSPPSPFERLLVEKQEVVSKCSLQEKKLQDDFEYIRHNSSSIVLSGLSSLLFPSRHPQKKSETQAVAQVQAKPVWLSVANAMMPVLWEAVRPLLYSWGIKKAKSILLGLIPKKRNKNK